MDVTSGGQTDVKVSVAMITYNHERFIAQAIEGVLMQQTDFQVELIIGEDCSSDGTREIVRRYGERYPEQIRPLLPERNIGAYANAMAVLEACLGEYIATCEGDDYWTDPTKLQKQVELLDAKPDCTMCFHNADNLLPDGSREDYIRRFGVEVRPYYTLSDIVAVNFIPTCSVVFRKEALPSFHPMGDKMTNVLLAQRGKLAFIDEVWGVRRVHSGGIISMKSDIEKAWMNIECLSVIYSYVGSEYTEIISAVALRHFAEIVYGLTAQVAEHRMTAMDAAGELELASGRCSDESLFPQRAKSKILSNAYVDLAFASHKACRFAEARSYWLKALGLERRWVQNLGFCSVGVDVFLGPSVGGFLRRGMRAIR
jgi:glycosyltransferase involved in cell wall biosynthesis